MCAFVYICNSYPHVCRAYVYTYVHQNNRMTSFVYWQWCSGTATLDSSDECILGRAVKVPWTVKGARDRTSGDRVFHKRARRRRTQFAPTSERSESRTMGRRAPQPAETGTVWEWGGEPAIESRRLHKSFRRSCWQRFWEELNMSIIKAHRSI